MILLGTILVVAIIGYAIYTRITRKPEDKIW